MPAPEDSERAIEIPWAASAIASCVGLWLDIGYAYAEPRYWQSIPRNGWRKRLRYGYGLDAAPAQYANVLDSELVGDIMDYDVSLLPRFNLITCISTLEHLGCDNTVYHEDMGRRDSPFDIQKSVLAKLIGALSRSGRLFVSVPFGAFEDHGWFLQYNHEMVRALAQTANEVRGRLSAEDYYGLATDGWRRRSPASMAGISYRPDEHRASGVALLEFSRR